MHMFGKVIAASIFASIFTSKFDKYTETVYSIKHYGLGLALILSTT